MSDSISRTKYHKISSQSRILHKGHDLSRKIVIMFIPKVLIWDINKLEW